MNSPSDLLNRLLAPLLISQHKRLLQLETALPSCTLVVERAQWIENLSGLSETPSELPPLSPLIATVDCLSTSASLELKTLIGEQVSLRLMLADGSYRTWHGYVAEAAQLGSDGGLAPYRIKLVGFTYFMSLRTDTRVFMQQRAHEIIERVLKAYPQANFRFELSPRSLEAARMRGVTTQWRETDAQFVSRLAAEEGWNWSLEHVDDGQPLSSATAAKHCLVIGDAQAKQADLGSLRFGRPDVRSSSGLPEDTITAIASERQLQSNAVTHGAWDPRRLAGVSAQASSVLEAGDIPALEIYDGRGERSFSQYDIQQKEDRADPELANQRAALKLARCELAMKTLHGESAVRTLAPGANFALTDHFLYSPSGLTPNLRNDNQFRVLQVIHEAANNLGTEAAQLLRSTDVESGSYSNRFTAVAAAATVVPPFIPRPTAHAQTALVVGHVNEPLTTDRDLRVRVQFPWQRGRSPLAGGLSGPLTPAQEETGHAPANTAASMPVRVAQPSAGPNWGAVFTPRIGTEVLVDFLEGDIDRPIILGQLYNGADNQPWPAGVDSGANHPGVIAGWQSQELAGDGLNQWLIDDTTGQCRMRLASTGSASPWSELSLGHVISQGARSANRGPWLGSGFYAHTDGWASVRADGLLVSTTDREGTYGSAVSTQMDAAQATSHLKAAQQLGQAMNDAAAPLGAMKLDTHTREPKQALQALIKTIDPTQDGKYEESMGGQESKKAQSGSRELGEPVERFATPVIVFDTPGNAALTSPAAIASFAGQDTSIAAQGDFHEAADHTASFVSGQTTSLYNHEGELQAYAANGNVSLRAHTDQMEFLADQSVKIISVNDEIRITAKRIEMIGGDSKVVLDGANIDFVTPGSFVAKGSLRAFEPGGSGTADVPSLPVGVVGELVNFIELNHDYEDLEPRRNAPYKLTFSDGSVRTGTLDNSGFARLEGVPAGVAKLELGEDPRTWKTKAKTPNAHAGGASHDDAALALIQGSLQ